MIFARQRGYTFNQINKQTIKIYSNLSCINTQFYLTFRIPMCHRLFFRRITSSAVIVK